MEPLPIPAEAPNREVVAFLVGLIRLQREVRDVGRQLDRIEAEMRDALSEVARERFEEYR
jgi:hypothetical protein